jgi:hypothetical protein
MDVSQMNRQMRTVSSRVPPYEGRQVIRRSLEDGWLIG